MPWSADGPPFLGGARCRALRCTGKTRATALRYKVHNVQRRLYHGLQLVTISKILAPRSLWIIIVGLAAAAPGLAKDFTAADVWSDTKLYFTSPLRWGSTGWLLFGGTVAAVGVAHEFDGKVRDHFAGKTPVLDGKDRHSTRDALPAAAIVAGTWALGLALDDSAGRIEAYRMLEAGALSSITTTVFKYGAGRARPNETLRVDDWRTGGSSFPSLHVTAAFAIGTVFAESGSDDYRWVRRLVGFGMASGTAYARLHGNVHWLSDVVAGAAIGVYTGAFTLDRQYFRDSPVAISVAPTDVGGVSLQFTYTPR
jgi:membrane-associated phospholipid phosphatase